MKSKIILFLMALPLCFGLAACGDEAPVATPTPPPQMFSIEGLIRNNVMDDPNDDYDGPAYVFCRISIEVLPGGELTVTPGRENEAYPGKYLVILTENESSVRDIINTTLRSKTLTWLKKSDAPDLLKTEIAEQVVAKLSERGITELVDVLFDEFYTTP